MMKPYKIYPFIMPPAYPDYNIPPTLYRLLNSIVNFDLDTNTDVVIEDKVKIKDLASAARLEIFDFDYPLTDKLTKEEFEIMILNNFLMRRIGYDTLTAFKIALNVKLNSIMPIYNKMFDMLDGWDLFEDGEHTSRTISDAGTNSISNMSSTLTSTSTSSQTSSTSTSDRRYSDTPQNQLSNVKDGKYITDYNYDTNTNSGTDSTTGSNTGSASSSTTGTDSRSTIENVTRTPSDKLKIYKEFIENRKSIYEMIFSDLDELFYGIV